MMDDKMRAALDAWQAHQWAEFRYIPSAHEIVDWTLDYLRSQQEKMTNKRKGSNPPPPSQKPPPPPNPPPSKLHGRIE